MSEAAAPVRTSHAIRKRQVGRAGYWVRTATLLTLLLVAFALRTRGLHLSDLTFDEVATVFVARRPLGDVITYVMRAAREHPPFYYLLMSLWMQAAGETEFAIRCASALISIVTIAWGTKLGRQLFRRQPARGLSADLWIAMLLALAPFSVWAGRNGRMYALVMALAIVIMERWLSWTRRPDQRHGLVFIVLFGIGAMTHYYLVLLWAVQGLLLLLLPSETRSIRKTWIATAGAMALAVGAFAVVSPGVRAMVLEVAHRFPVRNFRWNELHMLFTDLFVWGYRPELVRAGWLGLALTGVGWIVAWLREPRTGKILVAWGLAPLIFLHFVPEKLEARYLMPVFPALILGLAAIPAYLGRVGFQGAAAVGLLWFALWRLPVMYEDPDTTFSSRMRVLHSTAEPGDGLVMNGPWPALLLEYYTPPDGLTIRGIPPSAPPGFSAEKDIPRLIDALERHPRLWVSYGAIHWADPEYSVSRWLAENTYCVFERYGLALYSAPRATLTDIRGATQLSENLQLSRSAMDRQQAQVGDIVQVLLEFTGVDLGKNVGLRLALLDAEGTPWQEETFDLGPLYQPTGDRLPSRWREQRGFLIQPGIPPGDYVVALKAYREGIPLTDTVDFQGWTALGDLTIDPGRSESTTAQLLPGDDPEIPIGGSESLVVTQFEPHSDRFMQGYLVSFSVWWRVRETPSAQRLSVRLVGPDITQVKDFPLGPSFYPATHWQPGNIIRQDVTFQLPDDLPAGDYTVQVQVAQNQETGPGTAPVPEDWTGIASIHVEARDRQSRPPLFLSRRDVQFGTMLRLRGYRLTPKQAQPGEQAQMTVYWQAMQRPDRVYAVFNHLRAADGTVVWQGDSWPQGGVYTTDHWLAGEVVPETTTMTLPAELPPGTYTFYTGVYDPATGDRLTAVTGRGQALTHNELALFEWVVEP